jgi:hypothetical protein
VTEEILDQVKPRVIVWRKQAVFNITAVELHVIKTMEL